MKANTHPQFYPEAEVKCACGNTFTTGSTLPTIHLELCNKCHPFYTGEARFVDSASRIKDYERKKATAQVYISKKVEKKEEQRKKDNAPKSLREMLGNLS